MGVDIRCYTRVVIEKDGQYLFCVSEITREPEWRHSPWDAWYTRDADEARTVARVLSAVPVLFNPVVGKVAVM